MANFSYNIKNDNIYKLGANIGFFAAFLIFASIFYLIMGFLDKLPQALRYYHVIFFVSVTYIIGFAVLKFRK